MKSLLVGLVVFDLILHVYQLVTSKYLIFFPEGIYDIFWTTYWGLFLILLVYEFKKNRRNNG